MASRAHAHPGGVAEYSSTLGEPEVVLTAIDFARLRALDYMDSEGAADEELPPVPARSAHEKWCRLQDQRAANWQRFNDRQANRRPVTVATTVPALPPIAAGQLRCQRCAKGVVGRKRFCDAECARGGPDLQRCAGCGATRPRLKGRNATVKQCEQCPVVEDLRVCLGCAATSPRKKGQHATSATCDVCTPPIRTCSGCGNTRARRAHENRSVMRCEACPPPTRVMKPRAEQKAPVFKQKVCAFDGCEAVFAPGGPRALYCPEHRP